MNQYPTTISFESEKEQCQRAESSFSAATPLKWLDDCIYQRDLLSHHNCIHLRERQRSLPRRLLDIGVLGNWPCVPKLIETSGSDPNDTEFVALSHVWGSLTGEQKATMSTTKSSLLARQEGIELASIPLQYRAVVILCRCLCFRYLWIDSLCIIQGLDGDWAEEFPRMASIYGSAALTIAVNTKQNLFDSFFAEHKSYAQQEPPTEWVMQYKRYDFTKDSGGEKWLFTYHNFQRFLYGGGIIGSRAWCLQERQLSSRIIHLLDNSVMLWECPSLLANTATPEHFPFVDKQIAVKLCQDRNGGRLAMYQRYADSEFHRREGDSYQRLDNHLYIWHIMLRDIGYRNLTFSSDNLAAIAGIAAQVNYNTGLTYLSGIWKEDIPRGLLWTRTPDREMAYNGQWKRFSRYQGPSWSWCSVKGPTQLIEYNDLSQMPIALERERVDDQIWVNMIHDVEIHRSQDSAISEQLGILQRGSYLSIKGYLGQFQCSGEEVSLSQYAGRDRYSYVRELGGGTNLFDLSRVEKTPGFHMKGAAIFDLPEECIERTVWCFLLAEAPEEPRGFGVALVLDPASDLVKELTQSITSHGGSVNAMQRPRDFRRIGLAFLQVQHSDEWTPIWAKHFGDMVQLRIF